MRRARVPREESPEQEGFSLETRAGVGARTGYEGGGGAPRWREGSAQASQGPSARACGGGGAGGGLRWKRPRGPSGERLPLGRPRRRDRAPPPPGRRAHHCVTALASSSVYGLEGTFDLMSNLMSPARSAGGAREERREEMSRPPVKSWKQLPPAGEAVSCERGAGGSGERQRRPPAPGAGGPEAIPTSAWAASPSGETSCMTAVGRGERGAGGGSGEEELGGWGCRGFSGSGRVRPKEEQALRAGGGRGREREGPLDAHTKRAQGG